MCNLKDIKASNEKAGFWKKRSTLLTISAIVVTMLLAYIGHWQFLVQQHIESKEDALNQRIELWRDKGERTIELYNLAKAKADSVESMLDSIKCNYDSIMAVYYDYKAETEQWAMEIGALKDSLSMISKSFSIQAEIMDSLRTLVLSYAGSESESRYVDSLLTIAKKASGSVENLYHNLISSEEK